MTSQTPLGNAKLNDGDDHGVDYSATAKVKLGDKPTAVDRKLQKISILIFL